MSATVSTASDVRSRSASVSTAVVVGAACAILGSVGYISMNGLPPREAFVHPVGVVAGVAAAIGCLTLGLALAVWQTPLPRWAALTSAAGVWFAGATAWSQSTVVVAAATKTSNEFFDELFFQSGWVLGGMAPKSVLCLVGFLGLAIAGWRDRSVPRSAAAALAVAGVLSLWPPFPPGLIVAALALIIIARTKTGATR